MDPRTSELQSLLTTFAPNVYFQPPESVKLKFPCITYSINPGWVRHANNNLYTRRRSYTVTYIHRDPGTETVNRIEELPYCSYDRRFAKDNLYHDVFELYY